MKTKLLKNKKDFFISSSSPFHFDGTFHKPSHFPDKLSDWESGKYWQAIRIGKKLFGIKIKDKGKIQQPEIKVSIFYNKNINNGEIENIKQEIIWRFNLDSNLKEFNKLAIRDKRFYPIFKK